MLPPSRGEYRLARGSVRCPPALSSAQWEVFLNEVSKEDRALPANCRFCFSLLLAGSVALGCVGCRRAASPDDTLLQIREEMGRGQFDAALHDVDGACEKYRTDGEWAARFRVQKAHVLMLRGSYSESLQLLNEPLPLSLARTDAEVQGKMVEGLAQNYLQQFGLADHAISQAESLAATIPSAFVGDVAQARGILEMDRKNYMRAAEAYRTAATFARKHNLPRAELRALASLGNVAMWQEHYDEAAELFKMALERSRLLEAAGTEATTLGNLGWTYLAIGDLDNAEIMFKEAEAASAKAGMPEDHAYWLLTLGNAYYQQHRYAEAEAASQQALALERKMDDKRTLTECLNTLSEIELATGRVDAAETHNREALEVERAGLDQFGIASSKIIAGRIAASKRQFREAEKTFQEVIGDKKVETPLRWESEARLAQLYADENLSANAEVEFRRAINTIEAARAGVHRDEFRLSFLSAAIEFYDDYIDFLVLHKREAAALHVAELSRARTLEEGLATVADKAKPRSSSLQPQQLAKRLKATLLFYWMGHNQSYLWVITPARIAYFTLPKADEIEPIVKSYEKTVLGMRDAQDTGSGDGKRLYEMLVGPAKKLIPQGSRAIVLPDESLYGLNFETLVVPDPQTHFWIEDVMLSTASSLTLLERSSTGPATKEKNLLLVGNAEQASPDFPPLLQAPAEMQKVGRYFPDGRRRVLDGKQATPSAYLTSNPERFTYLHFVTHGTASHTRPLESAVILSKEGDSYKLYARDIVQHRLSANLVTISACNGSGTRAYSGEGLVGLSWAFLRAGAHNVIGALWEVSDASTPQLMDTLYGELSQGKDPATALRDAKLTLLHSNDPRSVFKKPFYWAPFQLYAGS
jgi:CHAT domain-containing protein